MDRISENINEVSGRGDVVGQSANRSRMSSHVNLFPLAEERNDKVALKLLIQNLGEEVEVGDKSGLQDDGDVAGVEKLDGVGLFISLNLS